MRFDEMIRGKDGQVENYKDVFWYWEVSAANNAYLTN
jgi:hypothetical protein